MNKQISDCKTNRAWCVIAKRELKSYFTSPVAYIVECLFLLFAGFLVFSTFFLNQRAELRSFFQILPLVFSFFIPALTMRTFSEEMRSGSFETLLTLPVTPSDIVIGKYIASLAASLVLLVPTFFYVITCYCFGNPDGGTIVGGYIGAVFLAAAFTAIGMFASSSTKNQIVSFFIAFAICIVFSVINSFSIFMPGVMVGAISFVSATSHFDSISRGIIDSRDVIYFVSLASVFFVLTVRNIENSRKV